MPDAPIINIRTGKRARQNPPGPGGPTMKVKNTTEDHLGAYGVKFEPGQTRDLPKKQALALVEDNPQKFKLTRSPRGQDASEE